jgi:Rrf2 family protein
LWFDETGEMANLVRISEAASLGLHTMALLAKRNDRRWTNQDLADTLGASAHHLAKVMQRLVRAGMVSSTVGPQGGFQLAGDACGITLMDIYQAIEGPLPETGCLLGKPICDGRDCILGELVQKVEREIRSHLASTTLAQMVNQMAFLKTLEMADSG